jgi:hypothetical protein
MRHEDWQRRFWDALKEMDGQPFKYGSHDCILFGARMADVITVDGRYEERAREQFSWFSAKDALTILAEFDLKDCIEQVLGPMQRWQFLQQGDLILLLHDSGRGPEQVLGVHDGVQVMAPREVGIGPLWWSEALGGWRIE